MATIPTNPTPIPATASSRRPLAGGATILILLILIVLGSAMGLKGTNSSSGSSWISWLTGPHAPPLCGDSLALDTLQPHRPEDFSKSDLSLVDFAPASKDKVCLGTLVSIPSHWTVWDAQFLDPDAKKDGCVAWFEYWGIDKIYGPYYANQTLAFSDMPGKWRIASNCTIRYHQEGG